MSAANFATCQFCSKPDDSIQVICESRCLICSRCQLVPVIRKLLIDHTEFSSPSNSNVQNANDNTKNCSGFNNNNQSCSAIRGTCPICTGAISSNMLYLIQGFYDGLRADDEDMIGKVNTELLLEENCPVISSFLKRFKSSYSDVPQVNLKAFTPSSDKDKGKKKNKKGDEVESDSSKIMRMVSGLSLQDVHSGPVKLGIPSVLEFVLDCYCAMWQTMIRCGNESMLAVMLKQVCKKKYSQKTNDFRTKSLLDSLMSSAGTEIPELMVFCNLVGILPKLSGKISAAWGHIATAILAASHCDRCLKYNTLIDGFGNPTVNEFRSKLSKTILFQGYNVSATSANSSKNIPLKKAFRIIQLLLTTYQPSWIMAPMTSACVEYQSRLPWSAASVAKLYNVLLFIALFDQTISSRLSVLQAENSGHNISPEPSNFGFDPTMTGKNMSKALDKSQQSLSPPTNKARVSQSLTQLPTVTNKQPFQPQQSMSSTVSPGRRSSIGVELSMSTTNAMSTQSTRNHRRTNIGLDEANIQRSMKNAGRIEMMKNIDSVISKLWFTSPHPYLYLDPTISPENQLSMMQYMMSYLGNLDIAGTSVPKTTEDSERSMNISEEPSLTSDTNEKHQHRHHHRHHHHHHPHSHTLHQQHHQHQDLSKQSNPWRHLSPQEQPVHHIRMDLEQALFLADSLSISMHDFILVTVRAWNTEYESIKTELQRVQLLQQRRAAITGHYDSRQAKMTAQERLTITRLLQWYKRGEEIIGIDWDEVDEQSAHHYFPFSLPKSLLMKSRNELQVLADQVIQTMLSQSAQDNAYYGKPVAVTTKPGVNLNSLKINAYGSVAGLLSNTDQQADNEQQEFSDLTLLKGISGGTAIQDNLPEDEVRLLVGQVSPREVDDGSAHSQLDGTPSVTSSVELYMLASELERGMGYTNSIFPAFRKQELQIEQAMTRLGIAEGDEFNHRHHDYDEEELVHHHQHHHHKHHHHHQNEEVEDDFDSGVDEDRSPEKAKEQWRKAKSHTSAHLLNDKVVASSHNVIPVMRRASSQKSSGMIEGSTSLTDMMDGLLPPLEAPPLDPTLSGGTGTSSQTVVNKSRSMTTILPNMTHKSASSLLIPQRLQSPANGGERPPSGSLVRFQLEKKRINSANKPAVVTCGEKTNLSKRKEEHHSDIGQAPGKKINIVDMIDVDGEVLERSGLTPGLSKTLQFKSKNASSKSHLQDNFILEDSSINAHPLEDAISSFPSANRIRSGSKLNRKPVHQVNVDIVEDRDTKKYSTKIVVEENFANSSFQQGSKKKKDKNEGADGDDEDSDEKEDKVDPVGHRVGGGTVVHLPPVLNLEERRKFTRARLLSVVDRIAEDYNAVMESQKKARISHVRTKVMQRASGFLEDGKNGPGTNKRMNSKVSLVGTNESVTKSPGDYKGKDNKKSGNTKENDTLDQTDNSTVTSDSSQLMDNHHQVPILSSSSFPTIPENSISTTLSATEKAEDFLSRPTLDLSNSVHSNGKFVIDLSDSLVAESIVTRLILRNTNINLPSFKLVVKTYCNPWQLESIRLIDFSGNPCSGGFMAAKAFGNALASYCHLIELNVNGMKLGDSGLQCLLQGIIQGGGHECMQSLKLQQNDITMATNAISFLGHFLELKSLDLSHNMFTLDTHAQTKFFTEALEGLMNLEAISLAYNKIQDKGFSLVLNLLVGQVPLRVLDVAGCFITNFSLEHIRMILQATPKAKDKRYTTTLSMSLTLDEQANPGRPPLLRGLSRFLHLTNMRDSTDLHNIEAPSNTRESSAYQPAAAPIQLAHLLMQESLIPQNVWDGLRDMMAASSCKIYLHEAYSGGIDHFPVFDISEFHV